jgi:hypothetical protein
MLTTTLDGLWTLQVLTGIEVLAPELGLRPHLPSVERPATALAHPAAAELQSAGVIDAGGAVDEAVLEWLTVLSRRDIALLLNVHTPDGGDAAERILLARFAKWWVSLERDGMLVRVGGAGIATSEDTAGLLIHNQIERLCGQIPAADFRPITLDATEVLSSVRDSGSLRNYLSDRKLDTDQVGVLTLATDATRSAQASIVAIQCGTDGGPARCHVESGVVTIIDTPRGRLVAESVREGERSWLIVSPGSQANIASAVLCLLRNLPAGPQWHSSRKVV